MNDFSCVELPCNFASAKLEICEHATWFTHFSNCVICASVGTHPSRTAFSSIFPISHSAPRVRSFRYSVSLYVHLNNHVLPSSCVFSILTVAILLY